jgi:hypothetical protein
MQMETFNGKHVHKFHLELGVRYNMVSKGWKRVFQNMAGATGQIIILFCLDIMHKACYFEKMLQYPSGLSDIHIQNLNLPVSLLTQFIRKKLLWSRTTQRDTPSTMGMRLQHCQLVT